MTIDPLLAIAAGAGLLAAGLLVGLLIARRHVQAVLALAILAAAGAAVPLLLALRPVPVPRADLDQRPPVRVAALAPQTVELAVEAYGSVRALGEHDLAAEVGGVVTWVAPQLEPGGAFAAGEALVRIAPERWAAAVERAGAEVAQAALALAQEQAAAEQARREWARLGQGDAGPLTRYEPQLAAAAARLAAARAAHAEAGRDLERTQVRPQIAGRVRTRSVEPGQLVAAGSVLARVHRADAVEVPLAVAADDLAVLALAADFAEERAGARGPLVELRAAAGGSDPATASTWTGRVVRTVGAVDPATRLITLLVRVEQPFAGPAPLLPGAFVLARIRGRSLAAALVVPRAALRDDGSVLTVDADGRIQRRAVTVLHLKGEEAVLAPTLPAGERLCLTRLNEATPGTAVRVVEGMGAPGTPGGQGEKGQQGDEPAQQGSPTVERPRSARPAP